MQEAVNPQHEAKLRVTSEGITPNNDGGDIVKVKAAGHFADDGNLYPVSIHFETYPGDGVVPFLGDHVIVTIRRATDEENRLIA